MSDHTCKACGTTLTKRPGVGRWPTYCPTPCRSGEGLYDGSPAEDGAGPTLWVLARTFLLEQQVLRGWQPNTVINYRYALYDLLSVVGPERPASTFTRRHIEDWLGVYAPPRAPGTVRHAMCTVSVFCDWLVGNGYVQRDPAYGIPRPRKGRRIPRALSHDAIRATVTACPDVRAQLMVSLMCQEGLRCMEVAGLQIGDIDEDDRSLRVIGKRDRERILPMSDETWSVMERYLAEHPAASGPLIRNYLNARPLQPHYVGKIVSDAMRAAGVKKANGDGRSAHALRHTAATDMLRAGAHILDVRTALGHSHVATTEIYLPALVGDLRTAMGGRSYRSGLRWPENDGDLALLEADLPTP